MMSELEHHVPSNPFVMFIKWPVLIDLITVALTTNPGASSISIPDYYKSPNLLLVRTRFEFNLGAFIVNLS